MEGNSTRVFTIWAPKLYLVSRNLCADEEGSIAHHSRIDSWIFSSCCCSLDELVFWLLLATMQSFPSQFSKYMSQIERYRSLFASQRWYLCRSSTLFEGQRNQHNRRNDGALLFFLLLSWSLPGVHNCYFCQCTCSWLELMLLSFLFDCRYWKRREESIWLQLAIVSHVHMGTSQRRDP